MTPAETSHKTTQAPPPNLPPKILAIEDDPGVSGLYKSYLEKRGYKVLAASNAIEGMELLRNHSDIKLVILDFTLPGMSGEEWLLWFLEQERNIPIIIATDSPDILAITKGNNELAALTKPFHMEELQELIEVLLSSEWQEQISVEKGEIH